MPQRKQPVSIVVPTLNEAGNIDLLFQRIDNSLSRAKIPYEIIVVDDHSNDDTAIIAQNADPKYKVNLVLKDGEPGKAFSLLQGFKLAKYDLICMIDGDLQYPPEAIPAMVAKLERTNADVVLTRRINNKTSALRKLSSNIFNYLFVRLLFGIDYDTQSGEKLFKKKVIESVELTPSPWSFDLEFIIRSLEQEYVLVEHDIPFGERYSGVPKIKMFKAVPEMIKASVSLRRRTSYSQVRFNYSLSKQISGLLIALLFGTIMSFTFIGGQANALASNPATTQTTSTPTAATSTTSTTDSTAAGSTAQSQPVAYYKSEKLSNNSTKTFLNIAKIFLEVGIFMVGLGIIIVMAKSFRANKTSQKNL